MYIDQWLQEATKYIRFAPDRRAVERELHDHYQDLFDRQLARGKSRYEAERAAMAALGDPADIAADLGRLHAPWWGYVWRASRWIAVVCALWLLFSLGSLAELEAPYSPRVPENGLISTYADGSTSRTDILRTWSPSGSAKLGQYRLSAPVVWLEQTDPTPDNAGDGNKDRFQLTICLKVSTWKLWEACSGDKFLILNHVVTDSAGNFYGRWDRDYSMYDLPGHYSLHCYSFDGLPGAVWYEVYLELPEGEAPEWVKIPFGRSGEYITVNLSKEVVG